MVRRFVLIGLVMLTTIFSTGCVHVTYLDGSTIPNIEFMRIDGNRSMAPRFSSFDIKEVGRDDN